MAKNTVKIIDNYIEIRFVGDQSYDSVKEVADKTMAACQELIDRDEWVRVFVDLSEQGKTTSESRKASKEAYNYGAYDKIVITGANSIMTTFVNTVIKASGRQSSAKVENDKEKALAWLKEDPKEFKI
jgi:hypothetical protein